MNCTHLSQRSGPEVAEALDLQQQNSTNYAISGCLKSFCIVQVGQEANRQSSSQCQKSLVAASLSFACNELHKLEVKHGHCMSIAQDWTLLLAHGSSHSCHFAGRQAGRQQTCEGLCALVSLAKSRAVRMAGMRAAHSA